MSSAFLASRHRSICQSSAEFTALKRFPEPQSWLLGCLFSQNRFKPRNKVLHQGVATFTETDARTYLINPPQAVCTPSLVTSELPVI
jgi:hypothetical protein